MKEKHILIVDDDPITRYLLRGFLKTEEHYIVTSVEDGSECINFIKHNHVDLIISDVHMEDVGGIKLSKRLLSKPGTSSTPVILLSVRDLAEIERKARECHNVKKVVQKPYNRNMLLADLVEILA